MNLSAWILRKAGWEFVVNIPPTPKCVICIAPHTSNWDFLLGELAIHSVGMKAGFLMKKQWFFFPMGYLMRRLGGIPVQQHTHTNVTNEIVKAFRTHDRLAVGITPEGTRSANPNWHKGCLHIAKNADVPLVLAYFDYSRRVVCLDRYFDITDDPDADMLNIKRYYRHIKGRYPEKFVTGLEQEE